MHYRVNECQNLCGNFSFLFELFLSVLILKNDFVMAIIKKGLQVCKGFFIKDFLVFFGSLITLSAKNVGQKKMSGNINVQIFL